MLNKNQSKKSNSWKYTLILPALAVFMMAFQVNVITQENNKKQSGRNDTSQVVICKSSTDDYINESCERIKKEHNIDLKFSEIKRNTQGEILSIEGTFNDNKGTNGNYRQTRDTPINTLKFLIKKGKNGNDEIGFSNVDQKNTLENENLVSDIDATEPPVPPAFPSGPIPELPEIDMSKMPTPPVHPANPDNKKAMMQFKKEMKEFESKMEAFEPDSSAHEKAIEDEMAKRAAIFEKQMTEYENAMERYRNTVKK
jgi:hypothetical protein